MEKDFHLISRKKSLFDITEKRYILMRGKDSFIVYLLIMRGGGRGWGRGNEGLFFNLYA